MGSEEELSCIYLFRLHWSSAAARRLRSGGCERGYTSSRCAVLSRLTPAVEHRPQGRRLGVSAPGLQSTGSVVVAHGLNCSVVHGIFLHPGWSLCPLQWQVDSYPLDHHEVCPVFSGISKTGFLCPQALRQAGDGSVWSRRHAGLRAVSCFPGQAWRGLSSAPV